jgi:hypothetical protein
MATQAGNLSVLLNEQSQTVYGVVITGLIPASGTLQVGDVLVVTGQNFGYLTGALRVFIDDVQITAFNNGTDDSQLVFNVPITITNVPPQGRPATLKVSNAGSSAQRTLTLLPSASLAGHLSINFQSVSPSTIAAGQPATFAFVLTSFANLDATFALTAAISLVPASSSAAAWQSNLQLLDSNQNALPSNQITVPASQTVPMFVRIAPVPSGTDNTQFTLTLRALAAGLPLASSGPISQTVGVAASQPDTTIENFNYLSSKIRSGTGSITAAGIQLSVGGAATVTLAADFTVAGSYGITTTLSGGASNWTINPLSSTTPNPYPITPQQLSNPQQIAPEKLDFNVEPLTGATGGQVVFQLQRQGITQSATFSMPLTPQ